MYYIRESENTTLTAFIVNEQNFDIITHNSTLLLLKIMTQGPVSCYEYKKSTNMGVILHQRCSNIAALNILISTSQCPWL